MRANKLTMLWFVFGLSHSALNKKCTFLVENPLELFKQPPQPLKIFFLLFKACLAVQIHMGDCNLAFDNAWKNVVGDRAVFGKCSWHVERAWDHQIKTPWMLEAMKRIRTEGSERNFEYHFGFQLRTWLGDNPWDGQVRRTARRVGEYVQDTWGDNGR